LFTFSKDNWFLHFQSQLIVYILKVSWLFTFFKSANTKNYLNMEGIDLFAKILSQGRRRGEI
jgi:hypothetical protein